MGSDNETSVGDYGARKATKKAKLAGVTGYIWEDNDEGCEEHDEDDLKLELPRHSAPSPTRGHLFSPETAGIQSATMRRQRKKKRGLDQSELSRLLMQRPATKPERVMTSVRPLLPPFIGIQNSSVLGADDGLVGSRAWS
jgi:hypothetical protein